MSTSKYDLVNQVLTIDKTLCYSNVIDNIHRKTAIRSRQQALTSESGVSRRAGVRYLVAPQNGTFVSGNFARPGEITRHKVRIRGSEHEFRKEVCGSRLLRQAITVDAL